MPPQKRARHKKLEAPQDGIRLHSCRMLLDSKERHGEVDGCIFMGASYLSFKQHKPIVVMPNYQLLEKQNCYMNIIFYKGTLERE